MKLKTLASIGCLGVILAACGGGGSDDVATSPGSGGTTGTTGPTTSVTASAFASVDAFVAYVRGLAADETSEPVALPDAAAPTSDTKEPAA
jgi:uncharacterized protein YdeI (BOF family)